MTIVVDASVWVSAADFTDARSVSSRRFLQALTDRADAIVLPAFAHLEVACALSRRLQDGATGRALAEAMLRSPRLTVAPLDAELLEGAVELGTKLFLRAADAVYVIVARQSSSALVAWDSELVTRADALTPDAWMSLHDGS